jgi:hypothetical protein
MVLVEQEFGSATFRRYGAFCDRRDGHAVHNGLTNAMDRDTCSDEALNGRMTSSKKANQPQA